MRVIISEVPPHVRVAAVVVAGLMIALYDMSGRRETSPAA